jgi:metallo-beta-lactamase class B
MRLLPAALGLALTLVLNVSGASAQPALTDGLKALTVKWNTPTEPFTIIDNIHYVGTNGLSSFLVTTPAGHILIDTGLPEANPQIKASIEKLGFKVADIKILLNTHAHLDHTGGLADFKHVTGAQMMCGEADKPLLEGGYYPGRETVDVLKFPPVKVDRTVKSGDRVELGGVTLTAISTPGHSPGCTSWTTTVKDGTVARSVVIFCSGTVALNQLVGSPTHATIVEDYRKTFAWARGFKADVLLAPHPEMFKMQEKRAKIAAGAPNPFVDPVEFTSYTASLEKAFETALEKQREDLAAKK